MTYWEWLAQNWLVPMVALIIGAGLLIPLLAAFEVTYTEGTFIGQLLGVFLATIILWRSER